MKNNDKNKWPKSISWFFFFSILAFYLLFSYTDRFIFFIIEMISFKIYIFYSIVTSFKKDREDQPEN